MTRWQTFLMKLFMMDKLSYRNFIWEDIFIWCDMPEYEEWWEADNDNNFLHIFPSGGVP